jgi:hypothetical protein
MTHQPTEDEAALIDFLTGRCDDPRAEQIRRRLADDAGFRRLHDDLANTFAALHLLPEAEPPEDLARRTVARVKAHRKTEVLLAREEATRGAFRPTFRFRELAAIAAVLIVLGSVLIPSVYHARSTASVEVCAARIGQIGTGLLTYASANEGQLPVATSERRSWLSDAGQDAASNSAALFRLMDNGHVSSPLSFQCPAVGGGSFVVTAGMSDFPAGQYVSYSYQHAVGGNTLSVRDPVLAEVDEDMAILADSSPVFDGGRFHRERVSDTASPNHDGTGQNVLYLDMHVDWATDANVGVNGDNIYLADGIYEYDGLETPSAPTDTFLLPAYTGDE